MSARPMTFDEFYVEYRAQHRHPANRALHLLAKFAMLALLVVAIFDPGWWVLAAVPFAGVLPCWVGHRFVEQNQPTAWTRPQASLLGTLRNTVLLRRGAGTGTGTERAYWSALADLRMCGSMLGFGSDPVVDAANDRT